MTVTYRIMADSLYFKTLIARYYRQRPPIFWLPVQFTIVLLPCGAILLLSLEQQSFLSVTLTLIALVAAGAGAVALTKWAIFQRFKLKLDFGKQTTVTLTEGGIEAHGDHATGHWAWTAYPRSVRFDDGLLLMRQGVIRWLPDSAITLGSAEQATTVVAANSVLRMSSNNSFKPKPLRGSA